MERMSCNNESVFHDSRKAITDIELTKTDITEESLPGQKVDVWCGENLHQCMLWSGSDRYPLIARDMCSGAIVKKLTPEMIDSLCENGQAPGVELC